MLIDKVLVKDVMVKNPYTINIDEPFSRVEEMFRVHQIRHLPVVDTSKKLRGIISQRDLYRILSPRKNEDEVLIYDKKELDKFILKYVMSTEMVLLNPEDTIGRVMDIMITRKYGCVPIVDSKGVLCGIVTQLDLLKAIRCYFV